MLIKECVHYLRLVSDKILGYVLKSLFLGMVISNAYTSPLTFLWGTTPDNGVQIGSPFHHLVFNNNYPALMWKPNFGVTFNSLNMTYFKSCDNDDAVGIGIQRNLYNNRVLEKNSQLALGYRLGMTYGAWCINRGSHVNTASDPHCKDQLPFLPAVELYMDYSYKSWGIEASILGPVAALSFIKIWDK